MPKPRSKSAAKSTTPRLSDLAVPATPPHPPFLEKVRLPKSLPPFIRIIRHYRREGWWLYSTTHTYAFFVKW